MPEEIMSTDRVDGRQKVTGAATYAAGPTISGLTYAVLAGSNIAKGTIKAIDTKSAEGASGVLKVVTYQSMPALPGYSGTGDTSSFGLKLFGSNRIYFDGQPIAVVVADTYERAVYAASLIKCQYDKKNRKQTWKRMWAKPLHLKTAGVTSGEKQMPGKPHL